MGQAQDRTTLIRQVSGHNLSFPPTQIVPKSRNSPFPGEILIAHSQHDKQQWRLNELLTAAAMGKLQADIFRQRKLRHGTGVFYIEFQPRS